MAIRHPDLSLTLRLHLRSTGLRIDCQCSGAVLSKGRNFLSARSCAGEIEALEAVVKTETRPTGYICFKIALDVMAQELYLYSVDWRRRDIQMSRCRSRSGALHANSPASRAPGQGRCLAEGEIVPLILLLSLRPIGLCIEC